MKRNYLLIIISSIIIIILSLSLGLYIFYNPSQSNITKLNKDSFLFNGESAFLFAEDQVQLGYRYPGSDNISLLRQYITSSVELNGWSVTFQNSTKDDILISNILATPDNSTESFPTIIFAAHYDTRNATEKDTHDTPDLPCLGANDGASGVAVLLELSRILQNYTFSNQIGLLFLDAEDQGLSRGVHGINKWTWSEGARYYANQLNKTIKDKIQALIVLDMIGDVDLNIYKEGHSNSIFNPESRKLTTEIWNIANNLTYQEYFINSEKYTIIDDHLPFINYGVPAIDIIDFDYPYHHTTEDTLDKISSESLQIVGHVCEGFLINRHINNTL